MKYFLISNWKEKLFLDYNNSRFYVYLNDSEEHLIEQMIYGIDCMRMAVLLYVFFYGLLNDVIVRNSYYNSHNYKVFLQYEAFYVLSNYLNTRIS